MSATPAVPATAPTTRALSEVVREVERAHEQRGGMVWPTSTWRITLSEGRNRPAMAAMVKTCQACRASLQMSSVSAAASTA